MSQDQKFQQRWEFRRRDDDLDSSSNDSKPSSIDEPVLKKNKLVSSLILPEHIETDNSPRSHHKGMFESNKGSSYDFEKANKMLIVGSSKKNNAVKKKKKGSLTDRKKKNAKCITHKPDSLEDFKMFVESTLGELKVARENMFTSMREEMKKLVEISVSSRGTRKKGSRVKKSIQMQHRNGIETGKKVQNCSNGSLKRLVRSKKTDDSKNQYQVHEERVNHDETIASSEKEKQENIQLSAKKPKNSSNTPDRVVSTSYLTLPTVLSKLPVENHYNLPGEAGNNIGMNIERENIMIDSSTHHSYFSRIQQEEQFGSFAQMGSKYMGSSDQQSIQNSSLGTGFPVPFHHGLDSRFNIGSQVEIENSSRNNSILGPRMNGGGIRFSGGSYGLTENFSANNYRSHMNYKTDGGLMAFGGQDVKEGRMYQN